MRKKKLNITNKKEKYCNWILNNCTFAQLDSSINRVDLEKKISDPSESVNLIGSDDVNISGDFKPVVQLEGYGSIDIPLSIRQVVNSIKSYLNDSNRLIDNPSLHPYQKAFNYITNIVVGNFGSGEFGHAISKKPHTIYINWEGMRKQIENALTQQVNEFLNKYGIPPEFTPDNVNKIRIKIAEQLFKWASSAIAHESRHARDFQDILIKMILTGKGDLSQAGESRAESEEGLIKSINPTI